MVSGGDYADAARPHRLGEIGNASRTKITAATDGTPRGEIIRQLAQLQAMWSDVVIAVRSCTA